MNSFSDEPTSAVESTPDESGEKSFSENGIAEILESIGDCFYACDNDWRLVYFNRAAEAYFNRRREEVLGKILWEVFPTAGGAVFEEKYREALEKQETVRFEARSAMPDNWVEVTVCPSKNGLSVYFRDVTARKEAEGRLRESAQQLQMVTDAVPALICYVDINHVYRFVNRRYMEWFGHNPEDIIGRHLRDVLGEAAYRGALPSIERAISGETFSSEQLLPYKDGGARFVLINYVPARDEGGTVKGYYALVQDISARKRAEGRLKESEERFRLLTENLDHVFWIYDWREKRPAYISPAAQRLFGKAFADTLGVEFKDWTEVIHPDDRERTEKAFFGIEEQGIYESAYRVVLPSGEIRWRHSKASPIRDEKDEILLVVGVTEDITDDKRAEEKLRQSENDLRTMADSIPQLAWMAEPDGSVFWYNRRWYEYTGITPGEMKGWGWQSAHDPEMLPEVIERWKHSIATGQPFEMEFPLKRADGEFRWFLTLVSPLRDSKGAITRWFGTNTDIHESRIAHQNAEFLDSVSEDLARFATVEEIIRAVGAKIGEYLKLSLCAFVEINEDEDEAIVTHDWHRDDVHGAVGAYRLQEFLSEDFQRVLRGGEIFAVSDVFADARTSGEKYAELKIGSFVCVPIVSGGRWRYLLSIHDARARNWRADEIELIGELTRRIWTRLERARIDDERERLLQSEQAARSEAERANRLKDEFLATLSHELRTPLTAILGWSKMLRNNDFEEDEEKRALETIERNARAQNQLIEDLLDVSRIITGKLRLDVRAVDLTDVIIAAVDAARPAAEAKTIRLQTLLDPEVERISGDSDRLQQVVWNLLSNAIKFTPKDGRVQVRLERVNSHVEIVVSDTGAGIEPEFLPFVFDRFRQSDGSTTRRHGGLGLGLAIVRQLVELHGGTVSVESKGAGQGAAFIISLPLLPVRMEPAGSVPRVHPKSQNNPIKDYQSELVDLRVLLVDDEADSRDLLSFMLESCGALVTAAGSAAEALELLARERFEIIVSDIGMPDEDGFTLIHNIRQLPEQKGGSLPAIALTAYARAEDRVQALRAGFQMHIAKPVEPAELIVAVANLAGRLKSPNGNKNT